MENTNPITLWMILYVVTRRAEGFAFGMASLLGYGAVRIVVMKE
jgi:hypothetical protein